jgi:3-oxoacyl-[acyl-carrier protein] reductase
MLEGKVALVTGASRGIGKAIAIALGQQGATVVGTATSETGANAISAYLADSNIEGMGLVLNLTEKDSIHQTLMTTQTEFAAPQILVNNAGITRDNLMLRMKQEEWDEVINTNLSSIYGMTKAVLKPMVKARWGRIISVSSIVGLRGNPGQANYAAAKAGLIGFSKSLAMEVASRGITVNIVAPGLVNTDMAQKLSEEQRQALIGNVPIQRLAEAEEVAAAVVYLASPLAGYVTGETLNVNGGLYMP